MLCYERLAVLQSLGKPEEHICNSSCASVDVTPIEAFTQVHASFNDLLQDVRHCSNCNSVVVTQLQRASNPKCKGSCDLLPGCFGNNSPVKRHTWHG